MATSISKAQADALAKGFFDNIGGSKDGLQPKETLSKLYQLAGVLVDRAQANLARTDRVASGALSNSLKVLNPEHVGKLVRIDISALYYYKFIDQGVKGLSGGTGKYSFKYPGVSKKMRDSIRKWVIREGLKAKTNVGGPSITNREAKRKSITETSNQVAYAIAAAVKQRGIKRNLFFSDAVADTRRGIDHFLGGALKIDIINSIPKKL